MSIIQNRKSALGTYCSHPRLSVYDPHHVPYNKRRGEVRSALDATFVDYDGGKAINPEAWTEITLTEITTGEKRTSSRTISISLNAEERKKLITLLTGEAS